MKYVPLDSHESSLIAAALTEFDRDLDSWAKNTPWMAAHFDEDPSEVKARLEAIARCKEKVTRAREIVAAYPLAASMKPPRPKNVPDFFDDYDYLTTPESEKEDRQL